MQGVLDKVEEKLRGSFQKIHLTPAHEQPKVWSEMNEHLWYLEKTQRDSFIIVTQEACKFLNHGRTSCEKFLRTVTECRIKDNNFEVKTKAKTYLFPLVPFTDLFTYVAVTNYPHIQILFVLKPENYFIASLCYSIEKGLVCVP